MSMTRLLTATIAAAVLATLSLPLSAQPWVPNAAPALGWKQTPPPAGRGTREPC